MTPDLVLTIGKEAILTVLMLAAPLLGFGLVVGLTVAIFQSATQIQEMTLTFVPKITAVMLSLLFFLPWMLRKLMEFTIQLFNNIPLYVP